VDLGRQHSLAHQASARLNMLAAKQYRLVYSLKAQRGAKALAGHRISDFFTVRIISSAVS
jgi:hypothetical protein